ncbi:unnamed protein product [Prorocentrum cordatum]|uniref:Uncharacterized protein n=1 Tax=Prorocentrum cordatum TaxID=2364126 RepID=A0ABN9XLY8_9DINO|nr:unnamed protein product [Polarella glacialis]
MGWRAPVPDAGALAIARARLCNVEGAGAGLAQSFAESIAGSGWGNVKESAIAEHVGRFLKTEAESTGGAVALEIAGAGAGGVSKIKLFLAKRRCDCVKTHWKHFGLVVLADRVRGAVAFRSLVLRPTQVAAAAVRPAASPAMLWHQTRFFTFVEAQRKHTHFALGVLIQEGLADAFGRSDRLPDKGDATVGLIHPAVMARAGGCVDILRHFSNALIGSNDATEVSTANVGQAIACVEQKTRVSNINQASHSSSMWSFALAACQRQLASTSKGELGDEKIDRAMQILGEDAALPSLLRRAGRIRTDEAFAAIDESVDHLFEATMLRNKRLREEQASMAGVFAACVVRGGVVTVKGDVDDQGLPEDIAFISYQLLFQLVHEASICKGGLKNLCERLVKAVGRFSYGLTGALEATRNACAAAFRAIANGVGIRNRVKDLVTSMGALPKHMLGQDQAAFLQSAFEIADICDSIDNLTICNICAGGSALSQRGGTFPDEPELEDAPVKLQLAFGLATEAKSSPMAAHVRSALAGSLRSSCQKLRIAVHIDGAMVEVASDSGPEWWKDVTLFFSLEFRQCAAVASGKAAASDGCRWECDVAGVALRGICEVIGMSTSSALANGPAPCWFNDSVKQQFPDLKGAGLEKDIASCVEPRCDIFAGGLERMGQLEGARSACLGTVSPRMYTLLSYFQGWSEAVDLACERPFTRPLGATVAESKELRKAKDPDPCLYELSVLADSETCDAIAGDARARAAPATAPLGPRAAGAARAAAAARSAGLQAQEHLGRRRVRLRGRRSGAAPAEAPASRVARLLGMGDAALVKPGYETMVGSWLVGTSGMLISMIAIGGYTRLSGSGLSMTDWRIEGRRLPSGEEEWTAEFENYKKYPEYERLHCGCMELHEFKRIYFIEWFHRMWGRTVGVLFGVPLLYFSARRVACRRSSLPRGRSCVWPRCSSRPWSSGSRPCSRWGCRRPTSAGGWSRAAWTILRCTRRCRGPTSDRVCHLTGWHPIGPPP